MTHRNARLTPVTRAELVEQVLVGWPQVEVARLFRVSRATVAKWVRRFREGGPDALLDRSCRPLRSPRQTDQLQEAVICATRRMLAWGPHRIGWRLGIARSTVYAVLQRAGLHRLAWLHRTTREIVRYEHARPGALVHLDIKKLGRIPQGGGKRILPGFAETHSGPQRGPRLGFDFLHVAVDDHSRYTYVETLALIHRRTSLGTALKEASGCSSESGIMVLEQKPARKQGAPNRCCHRTNPTVSASSLTTIAWWPMPACCCRPP